MRGIEGSARWLVLLVGCTASTPAPVAPAVASGSEPLTVAEASAPESDDCPPRVRNHPVEARTRGQPRPESEPLSEGLVAVKDVEVRRRGAIWWLVGGEQPHCERWRWRRRRGGIVLERRTQDQRTWYDVSGRDDDPGRFVLLGPIWKDLRRNGDSGVYGCAFPVVVVDADEHHWWLVPTTKSFDAYHPDDAQRWYLDEGACTEALEAVVGACVGC